MTRFFNSPDLNFEFFAKNFRSARGEGFGLRMGPAGKQGPLKSLFVRLLIFGLMIVALRFMYVVIVLGEKCDAMDFCFFSSPENLSPQYTVASYDSPNNLDLSAKELRRNVAHYSSIFRYLIDEGFLSVKSKSLCMDDLAALEVLGLKEVGVVDAVGVSKKKLLPLVKAGDPFSLPFDNNTFDLVFCGRQTIERSVQPFNLASEVTRIMKFEGFLVVHTSSAGDLFSLNSFMDLFTGYTLLKNRGISGLNLLTSRELILQKRKDFKEEEIERTDPPSECFIPEYKFEILQTAEPVIAGEPLKPWITLKRNVQNIKYLSSMVDISFKTRYVYIDVGARSYGSSIVSWFKKQYPKQNKTFDIYAIEADRSFHPEYASKKGVTLLPYAAWIRNETLSFEINGDPDQKTEVKGKRGMGRILPTDSSTINSSKTRTVHEIQAFDFAEWLKNTISETDFVVMKMDIEGTEFDLLPKLIETGAICLIDELFLECHYNRWQKCCPGERSPKYQNTYGQCFDLFSQLRKRGVLVHQWW